MSQQGFHNPLGDAAGGAFGFPFLGFLSSSCTIAHSACSRTMGSGCSQRRCKRGSNLASPELPIATQRFLSQPRYFTLLIGDLRNILRKSSSLIEASDSSFGLKSEIV